MKNHYIELFKSEYGENWFKEYHEFLIDQPNIITVDNLNQELAIKWVELHLSSEIKKKQIHQFGDDNPYNEAIYFLKERMVIHIHSCQFADIMFFESEHYSKANLLAKGISELKQNTYL